MHINKNFRDEEIPFPKAQRMHNCAQCGIKFPSLKELRAHKAHVHVLPTCSNTKTSYSRLMTARAIKKEEKPDEHVLTGINKSLFIVTQSYYIGWLLLNFNYFINSKICSENRNYLNEQ